jgi:hypothetical protein
MNRAINNPDRAVEDMLRRATSCFAILKTLATSIRTRLA